MSQAPAHSGRRHRVVVVGGGFGGLPATRLLAHSPVDVTLIDRRNHHLFQPLLYQVATGHPVARADLPAAAPRPAQAPERAGASWPRSTGFDLDRKVVLAAAIAWRAARVPVRQPDRRGRGRAVLLRARRVALSRPG